MTPELTLSAIVLAPVIFLLVLRVNATLVFLSLCLGSVLVQFVASDSDSITSWLATSKGGAAIHIDDATLKLLLLLLPVALTSIFMIRTIRGNSRSALNILPALGVGLLGALLVVPLLPPGLSHNIIGSSLWDQLQKTQTLIVGATALVCLLVLWLQRPTTGEGKHHKKHKG